MDKFIDEIQCLDKGYTKLITWMPWNMSMKVLLTQEWGDAGDELALDWGSNDLAIVNAAKASHQRESLTLDDRERGLIAWLANHAHESPFRHAIVQLEIKAPSMVARQWFKYRVGGAHTEDSSELIGLDYGGQGDDGSDDMLYARNEASRRYVTNEPEFYCPGVWREAPASKAQGSGANFDCVQSATFAVKLERMQRGLLEQYNNLIKEGVAPEMARLFLPAYGLYTYWRWTASLQAVCHFLNQRLEDDAQREIQEYAKAVHKLVLQEQVYPLGVEELVTKPVYL